MKRRDLVRHLEQAGELLRERGNHSVFVNRKKQKTSTVPHREINDHLARKICRDLEIQEP